MSGTSVRASASTGKRVKTASAKRVKAPTAEDILQAEFEAMMERSSQRLAKLNADMDELVSSLRRSRLSS